MQLSSEMAACRYPGVAVQFVFGAPVGQHGLKQGFSILAARGPNPACQQTISWPLRCCKTYSKGQENKKCLDFRL